MGILESKWSVIRDRPSGITLQNEQGYLLTRAEWEVLRESIDAYFSQDVDEDIKWYNMGTEDTEGEAWMARFKAFLESQNGR